MKTFGASVSVLFAAALAACGSTEGISVDAEVGSDVDADTTPDAAQRATVTITVEGQYASDELDDVPVLFFDPDGSLVADEETDNDGEASAELLAGGSVVVIYPVLETPVAVGGGGQLVFAFVDVARGAELRVGGYGSDAITVNTEITGDTTGAATQYKLQLACDDRTYSSTSTDPLFTFDLGCDEATAVLIAQNGTTPVELAYETEIDVDGSIALDSDYVDVDDADLLVTGFPEDTVTVTGSVSGQLPGIAEFGSLMQVTDFDDGDLEAELEGGLPGLGDLAIVAQLSFGDDAFEQSLFVTRPVTDEIDITGLTLPVIEDIEVDADDATMTWEESGPGEVNYLFALIATAHGDEGATWYIAGLPTDIGLLQLPVLPEDYEDFDLASADEVQGLLLPMNLRGAITERITADPMRLFGSSGDLLVPIGEGSLALSELGAGQ